MKKKKKKKGEAAFRVLWAAFIRNRILVKRSWNWYRARSNSDARVSRIITIRRPVRQRRVHFRINSNLKREELRIESKRERRKEKGGRITEFTWLGEIFTDVLAVRLIHDSRSFASYVWFDRKEIGNRFARFRIRNDTTTENLIKEPFDLVWNIRRSLDARIRRTEISIWWRLGERTDSKERIHDAATNGRSLTNQQFEWIE